jgi:hypothetical protein
VRLSNDSPDDRSCRSGAQGRNGCWSSLPRAADTSLKRVGVNDFVERIVWHEVVEASARGAPRYTSSGVLPGLDQNPEPMSAEAGNHAAGAAADAQVTRVADSPWFKGLARSGFAWPEAGPTPARLPGY